jgi:peptide/nickel transport system substrate-binding protein
MAGPSTRAAAALALIAALAILPASSAAPPARYGGTLVVGLIGDPDSLDPTVSRSPQTTFAIFQTMCQQLYETGSKLQQVPVLAASLPTLSADKLSYTIQLRQGVQFNDGTPFNAPAVVTTINRDRALPTTSEGSKYTDVASVEATGPYTVVYHLKVRDSAFEGNPFVLSPAALAAEGDNFAANPVCVGPFMFDHRVVGDNVTVIKSPYYYDRYHVYLDKIVFKAMPDQAAAALALRAGDVQALSNISTADLPSVQQSSNVQVMKAFQLGWSGLVINIGNRNGAGNPPYANVGTALASSPRLRQALEEAIDRNTLNRVVYSGLYQATCTEIPPADTPWYSLTKIPCTPYDPNDARKLVAASGIPNPSFRLLVSNTPDGLRRAQFIQAQAEAVGFDVAIDAVDSATTTFRRTSGDFDVYLGGLTPGGVDPSSTDFLGTADVRNYPGYSNPRLDYVLANGLKATDPNARAVNYRVAQQIVQADRPYIPLYNPATFVGVSTSVTGVGLRGDGVIDVSHARYL